MDQIAVPDDLSGLEPDELSGLRDQLNVVAQNAVESGPDGLSDEDIDSLEKVGRSLDAIEREIGRRAEITAERNERAEAALNKLGGTVAGETATEPAVEPEAAPAPEAEIEATEPTVVEGDDDIHAEEAPVPQPLAAAANGPEVVTDRSGRAIGRQLTTGLATRRPARSAPREGTNGFMTATLHADSVPGFQNGQNLDDVATIAELIAQKRHRFGMIPAGTREKLSMASGSKQIANVIGADPAENFAQIDLARREHLVASEGGFGEEAMVASGGCCAPFTPLYEFYRTAEPASPIEDSLPTLEAPRGGIRHIGCTDWRAAAGGVGFYTCDDGIQTDPMVEKPCIHVECPPVVDVEVEAVSQCVSFDNLQYRVFPEQVESFLADLAVVHADAKEMRYLSTFDAESTPVTGTCTYGSFRCVSDLVTRAVVRYRARNAMGTDSNVIVYAPSWVRSNMAQDVINDNANGVAMHEFAEAAVDAHFSRRNITMVWYRDLRNAGGIGNNEPATPQGSGALLPWPELANFYIHSPGTFVRLDGGSLDVGLVRDSILNRTNDLEIFMEEWIGLAMPGCESVRLTIEICPNGTAPSVTGTAAFTC